MPFTHRLIFRKRDEPARIVGVLEDDVGFLYIEKLRGTEDFIPFTKGELMLHLDLDPVELVRAPLGTRFTHRFVFRFKRQPKYGMLVLQDDAGFYYMEARVLKKQFYPFTRQLLVQIYELDPQELERVELPVTPTDEARSEPGAS